jgi:hypothetical protein
VIDWRPSAPEPGKDYSGVPQITMNPLDLRKAPSPARHFEFPAASLPVIILTP